MKYSQKNPVLKFCLKYALGADSNLSLVTLFKIKQSLFWLSLLIDFQFIRLITRIISCLSR